MPEYILGTIKIIKLFSVALGSIFFKTYGNYPTQKWLVWHQMSVSSCGLMYRTCRSLVSPKWGWWSWCAHYSVLRARQSIGEEKYKSIPCWPHWKIDAWNRCLARPCSFWISATGAGIFMPLLKTRSLRDHWHTSILPCWQGQNILLTFSGFVGLKKPPALIFC